MVVYTDHKPLTTSMATERPFRKTVHNMLLEIAEYTTDIRHKPGKANNVADALSRPNGLDPGNPVATAVEETVETSLATLDFEELAKAQATDPEIQRILGQPEDKRSGLKLTKIRQPNGFDLIVDTKKGNRPYLPESGHWRKKAFQIVHGLSHPGKATSVKLVAEKYVWPNLNREVNNWARSCKGCQENKVHRHVKSPVGQIKVPDRRFMWSHIDLVGPLPVSGGNRYILTMIDRTTRHLEAVPLPNATAETVADAYLLHWVARFGVPSHLTSDRGAQFTGQVWACLNKALGTKMHLTTAYHPQANGLVERQHRRMKESLKSRLDGRPDWHKELWAVLLGIRTTPRDDIGGSTAELVFGAPITVPGDLVTAKEFEPATGETLKRIRQMVAGRVPAQMSRHCTPTTHVPQQLASSKYVLVRVDKVTDPLAAKYTGPYRVLERKDKAFRLDYGLDDHGNDLQEWVSIDRLKPSFTDSDTFDDEGQIPAPARRGRGRPRKEPTPATTTGSRSRGRPPGSKNKKTK